MSFRKKFKKAVTSGLAGIFMAVSFGSSAMGQDHELEPYEQERIEIVQGTGIECGPYTEDITKRIEDVNPEIFKILDKIAEYGGVEGEALVKYAEDNNVWICENENIPLFTEAIYDSGLHSVNFRPNITVSGSGIYNMLHEISHAYHKDKGFGLMDEHSIEARIAGTLMTEASANTMAIAIAYEMNKNGHSDAWNYIKHSLYDEMQSKFIETLAENETDASDVAMAKAMRESWKEFFNNKGAVNSYRELALLQVVLKAGLMEKETDKKVSKIISFLNNKELKPLDAKWIKSLGGTVSGKDFLLDEDILSEKEIFGTSNKEGLFKATVKALDNYRQGNPLEHMAGNKEKYGRWGEVLEIIASLGDEIAQADKDNSYPKTPDRPVFASRNNDVISIGYKPSFRKH